MPVIRLAVEVTDNQINTIEEYLGGTHELLDELQEAAKARLRELMEAAKEESQPANAD